VNAAGRRAAVLLCVIPLALLTPVLLAPPAAAHAVLLGSEPAAGSTVTTAPGTVRLRFSEDVAPRFSTARLVDRDGRGVAGTRVERAGSRDLVLELPSIGDGAYGVLWQVLAEADGHTTSGVVVFNVGARPAGSGPTLGAALAPAAAAAAGAPRPTDVARRWLGVCLLAGMIGAVAVAGLGLGGARSGPRTVPLEVAVATARRRLLLLASCCAGLGAAVGVADAIARAGGRPPPPAAGSHPAVVELLLATRWGHLWLVREAALLALAALAWLWRSSIGGNRPMARRGLRVLPAAVAVLVIVVVSVEALGSHAAGLGRGRGVAIAIDAVHILTACLWLGALPALALLLRRPSGGEAGPGELLQASRVALTALAAGSVGLVVVTGLYSAGLQVETVDGLLTTPYGRALLLKTVLLLVVGGLGLVNSARLHGRTPGWLGRAGARVASRWPSRRLVLIEAGAGAVLLVAVGVLLESVPARGQVTNPVPPAATTVETASGSVADLVVTVSVTPNRPGVNGLTVLAASSRRPPPAPIESVAVELGGDAQAVALREVSAGRWFGTGSLDQPGSLRLRAVIRRAGKRLAVPLAWWVGPPVTTTPPGPAPGRRLAPYVDGIALSLLGVALAVAARWLVATRRRGRLAVVRPSRPPEPARRA
jgi:copper transport protein